jgi:PatG C-terminal
MTDDQLLEDALDAKQVSAVDQAVAPTVSRPVDVVRPTSRSEPPSFVYALGRIEPRFPSLSVEKEFAQVVARTDTAGLNDRQAFRAAISERQNRYLARNLCWVLVIESLETYVLVPRDPTDLDLLIESYRDDPRRDDLDAVIGVRGQIAPPELCNGLAVPVVLFDQIYSFDRDALVGSIPRPTSIPQKADAQFRTNAGQLFDQLTQLADNAGATDEHRALNYLTVRYPQIYAKITEMHERTASFTGVQVKHSSLSGVRSIVDVIFSFRDRTTDVVDKQYVRVDVTEMHPFLVSKLSPYYER